MTKAAIQEMQDLALFSIPTWNISPIKRALEVKPPQFVDIPLEEKDDSSDEEYCLDKEDETAEEVRKSFISAPLVNKFCSISQKPVTLSFWSNVDITGSSPCCARGARPRTPGHSECEEDRFDSPRQKPRQPRHLRVETVPMGPPSSTGPARPLRAQVCTFLEKLYAVEEELELSPICTETFQP
ncbi:GON-4-like protein isoform X2 [Oncorhynchus masou masou]|uniref:GON-4-like protein isoform X2 n=1 Tax=Oncorhynchus masou masou TaxID=90313 RepID=UPI00318368DD